MLQKLLDAVTSHSWIGEVFLVALATGVVHLVAKLLLDRLHKRVERTENLFDDSLLEAARRPLGWGIWIVGISWAAQIAGQGSESELFNYVDPVRQTGVTWVLVWFSIRFVRGIEGQLTESSDKYDLDRTTVIAVSKLIRASLIITGVLMVLQGLGFSISGVLAFGGIGGIAIGFASRDLLANFFGALMIFLDRPFSVGDWIRSPDKEIEGTVEEIGWRLTRIRTFDQRPLYVPNAVFTSVSVENPSRMLNRRIYETIGLRYADVEAMPGVVQDVQEMLKSHPDIDQNRTLMVNFVEFGASSLNFFIYTFTKTTVWTEFHAIKQDVLFRIAEIIRKHDAEIAFPTQTVQLVRPEP
jgi:MscS family membrane protein